MAKLHTSIALIQEPWVHKSKVCGFSDLKTHKTYYDKTHPKPRAVIVIDKSIKSYPVPDLTNRDTVAICVTINTHNQQTILVCSSYMPIDCPNAPGDIISSAVTYCSGKQLALIIGCDSNAHNTIWGSKDTNVRGHSLLDSLLSNNIEIANKGNNPTFASSRYQSVIDLTLISPNIKTKVKKWSVSEKETLSDHNQIEFFLSDACIATQTFQNPRKIDNAAFEQSLTSKLAEYEINFPFNPTPSTPYLIDCIDHTAEQLTKSLKESFDDSCPKSTVRSTTTKRWWNSGLYKLRKNVRAALQKAKRSNDSSTPAKWNEYRELRKIYKNQINKAKKESWQTFCSESSSISTTSKIQKILCKNNDNSVEWVKKANGLPTTNPKETITALLDTHFEGHLPIKSFHLPEPPDSNMTLSDSQIINELVTDQKIEWAVQGFESFKTPGPDGLFPICLKLALPHVLHIINMLFKLCLLTGYIPQMWRKSDVIFIPKPGKQTYYESKSFRPISLTCFLLKTLERLIELYLKTEVLSCNPLNPNQHAYTIDRSTDTAHHSLISKLERALLNKNSVLCTFLDIQGAFDHTTPTSIQMALDTHKTPPLLNHFISTMLQSRFISVNIHGQTITRSIGKGCPQGGILSPLLWNLVMDSLLQLLKAHNVWCIGYADDLVICVENNTPSITAEVTQHALSIIQKWCKAHHLCVNPKKAESLLVTRKHNPFLPTIKIFGEPINYQRCVKYLGVHIDQKLTWNTQIKQKTQKALATLWMCKNAISSVWGLGPTQIIWLLESIIHPNFLHGALVWWESAQKTSYSAKLDSINRTALLLATGAFRTTPTLALECITNTLPLHIKSKQMAMNSCYRLLRSKSFIKSSENGHGKIVNQMSEHAVQPSDHIPKCIQFCDRNIHFVIPPKQDWLDSKVELDKFDICIYTDGSSHELGVGSGIFITEADKEPKLETENEPQPDNEISISLSPTTTIFQAEITAISNAAAVLLSKANQNIALITDSLSCLQTLRNPVTKTKTKLECIANLNQLAHNNNVTLMWVPSHCGVDGNERADLLANIGAALETMGPMPGPFIAECVIKRESKELAKSTFADCWSLSKKGAATKNIIRQIKGKISEPILHLKRPSISKVINTITGHGPFRSHLHKLKLTDEPSCPKCGANSDCNTHFIFNCPFYSKIRKQILKLPRQDNQNQTCIAMTDLIDFVKSSDRFG